LSGISVKWEQGVKFRNGIVGEDGVFSCDVFSEDGLKVFGLD
jgi:hypothetical protein